MKLPPRIIRFGCIVEGDGEVKALPELIRRVLREMSPGCVPEFRQPPIHVTRDRFLRKDDYATNYLELARRQSGSSGVILVLLDADKDPPCQLAPVQLARLLRLTSHRPLSFVLAKSEFESWFLASIEDVSNPEGVRSAKDRLTELSFSPHAPYKPTADQLRLTKQIDLRLARRARSFDKFCREIARLVEEITTPPPRP